MFKREGIYPWGKSGDSRSDEICPCCGIQFGYQDLTVEILRNGDDMHQRLDIYKEWRNNWVQNGMNWWSEEEEYKPANWNPIRQLKNIGIEIDKRGKNKKN